MPSDRSSDIDEKEPHRLRDDSRRSIGEDKRSNPPGSLARLTRYRGTRDIGRLEIADEYSLGGQDICALQ